MHAIESIRLYHPDNLILNLYEVVHFVDDITEFYALLIVQDILLERKQSGKKEINKQYEEVENMKLKRFFREKGYRTRISQINISNIEPDKYVERPK